MSDILKYIYTIFPYKTLLTLIHISAIFALIAYALLFF